MPIVVTALLGAIITATLSKTCDAETPTSPATTGTMSGAFAASSIERLLTAIRVAPDLDPSMASVPRLALGDQSPVNTSHNHGLAPDYLGVPAFHDRGAIRLDTTHVGLTGYTRGWDAGTCILAVLANAPPGTSACNQGGFWDPGYRWVYPGQDSAAAFFGINGIEPVIRDTVAASFSTRELTNLGGERQEVGAIVLETPLRADQIVAINDASGPMRVQVSNGFFAYTLPNGFTVGGHPISSASADGKTILVDNWVRAIQPGNPGMPGAPGATATRPALPYWTPSGVSPGTGLLPDQVGETNASPPLKHYTVTIDGNLLAEAQYGGFKISDADIVNDARYLEIVGVNNKSGMPIWNELQPTDDRLDGKPMITHLMFGGCQNDDGKGLGICGAMLVGASGLKRVVVCSNPQTTAPQGATDCVLDTSSTIGWKSTKSSGYVLWVDPAASGTPRAVIDWAGNLNTAGRVFVGTGAVGVTLSPNGTVSTTASISSGGDVVAHALVVPGSFTVTDLPHCSGGVLGAHVFVTDARKPNEQPGQGSGVPADCARPRAGSPPTWLSIYSRSEVSR